MIFKYHIIQLMDELVLISAALGDPLRLKVMDLLAAGRSNPCCSPEHPQTQMWVCACDISTGLGLAPSKLAYHLGLLRAARLVSEQRRGKWVYYTINQEVIDSFTRNISARWSKSVDGCQPDRNLVGFGQGPCCTGKVVATPIEGRIQV